MEPLAFADNNPALHGHACEGLPILAPAEAAARFGASAVFVATVFTNGPVLDQLAAMGLVHLPLSVAAWQFPEAFAVGWPAFFPEGAGPFAERIRAAFALLADAASREEFLGQLAWRSTLDRSALPAHLPPEQTYFPPDLIRLGPREVFVDCGACDGDSLRAFLAHQSEGPGTYIAIEPDEENCRKLARCQEGRPADSFRIVPVVLGEGTGKAYFTRSGGAISVLHDGGEFSPVQPLDAILEGTVPTLVKMDIEGGEGIALEGGRETLARHRPALAIASYHKPSDLWEIPLQIRDISPGYRIHLRRHSDECWEEVCYAVPGRGAT
jgi:FkbM family methyltransferase